MDSFKRKEKFSMKINPVKKLKIDVLKDFIPLASDTDDNEEIDLVSISSNSSSSSSSVLELLSSDTENEGNFDETHGCVDLNINTTIKVKNKKKKPPKKKFVLGFSSSDESDINNDDQNKVVFPWIFNEKIYSAGVIGLHEEIIDFYNYSQLSTEEIVVRNSVFLELKQIILRNWPNAKIKLFGSFQTNLSLPMADLDVVMINQWSKIPFYVLESLLIKSGMTTYDDTKIISRAKVPIIKFVHSKSGLKIDISFNIQDGTAFIPYLEKKKQKYPYLPKLLLVVKLFLFQRKLNFAYTGGLSSYCLTLMMISFLEMHPRINIDNENNNLGVLLMEFFELIGVTFNYKIFGIRLASKSEIINKKFLSCYDQYKDKKNGLCIEDPINRTNNPAKGCYLFEFIRKSFHNAFNILNSRCCDKTIKSGSNSILSEVVNYYESDIKERKKVLDFYKENFGSNKSKFKFAFDQKGF